MPWGCLLYTSMPERFMRGIAAVNGIVWGPMGLGLLFGTGLLLTVRTRCV